MDEFSLNDAPEPDRQGRFSRLTEPLLRPREAADLLAVRESWVYSAAREGRLPCVRVGRHLRFLRSQLELWVEAQQR